MKGTVIEDEPKGKLEEQAGIGLECPDCGADMRKDTRVTIKAKFNQDDDKMETSCGDSTVRFICSCGYVEEVIKPQEDGE